MTEMERKQRMSGYISGLPHFSIQITYRNLALLTGDLAGSSVQPCRGTSTTILTYSEGHAQNGPPWELTKVYKVFHDFYNLIFTHLVYFLSSLKQWQIYQNRGLFSNIHCFHSTWNNQLINDYFRCQSRFQEHSGPNNLLALREFTMFFLQENNRANFSLW